MLMWWIAVLVYTNTLHAALDCFPQEVEALESAATQIITEQCQDSSALRKLSEKIQFLMSESDCSKDLLSKAHQYVTDARINPIIDSSKSCVGSVSQAKGVFQDLQTSLKKAPLPRKRKQATP